MERDVLLVKIGSSNSGFGIVQRGTELRPISSCCGSWMEYNQDDQSTRCVWCSKDYSTFCTSQGCSLNNWLNLTRTGMSDSIIETWLRNVLDDKAATLEVKWSP